MRNQTQTGERNLEIDYPSEKSKLIQTITKGLGLI